jgi:RNA polymerase sigma-70 factor (ECF subfamily)
MDRDGETDERLMSLAAYGAADAMHVLVRRHGVGLLTFLQRTLNDRDRAEEIFQDVFLAVWQQRERYQYPRPFRAWLFGVARKKCLEEFRRLKYRPLIGFPNASAAVAPEPSPMEAASDAESAAIVVEAVGRLPETARAVLILRVWNEFSYEEIAGIMDCTEGTARSHMCHALAWLRKMLTPRLSGSEG